jgi:polar amino acid transport system ATP-binding protein
MKLDIEGVTKLYNGNVALDRAVISIKDFKVLAIIGPSGGGKSTLLRMIGGLSQPDAGTIAIDGKQISFDEKFLLNFRRTVGTVFQSYNLFPHLTVLENIELPLSEVHHLAPLEAKERAMEYLKRFGLQEHAHKKPSQLSGGQSQRVAIVRAVATKARILLLDEPTSALDPLMTSEVLDLIMELRNESSGIILVSHHMGFVKQIADWVAYLDNGQVVEYAPTQSFFNAPRSEQVRHFLEKVLKYES